MDSPIPLYPTDFPPSYEAVMGFHGDSQVGGKGGGGKMDFLVTDGSAMMQCGKSLRRQILGAAGTENAGGMFCFLTSWDFL